MSSGYPAATLETAIDLNLGLYFENEYAAAPAFARDVGEANDRAAYQGTSSPRRR